MTDTHGKRDFLLSGSDLLAFGDWQEVAAELRFTPFAAKKAISLRDAFLRM